jgi:hypothetical protein
MNCLENIFTSRVFIEDLKRIETETQEYYDTLDEVWGKKNKVKEVSERLLRHHIYLKFSSNAKFYSSPISCDIALELSDVVLNIDVKTIDKVGNSGELYTTQFEHNQTSFLNKKVLSSGIFPGFTVKSNLNAIDPRTKKPLLTFLVKIGYSDDGRGIFNFINSSQHPSLVITCLPNGALSNLFDNDLFNNFKDYIYYDAPNGAYYKPRFITNKDEFSALTNESKFTKIEQVTDIPETWKRVLWSNKIGYFDSKNKTLWWTVEKKKGRHWDIYLYAVKKGNTARFNDEWLEERYNSNNKLWRGVRKYYKIYDILKKNHN